MELTEPEEDRLNELEDKQNLTELEANELQVLLDKYYDQPKEGITNGCH